VNISLRSISLFSFLISSLSTSEVVAKHQHVPVIAWFLTEVVFKVFTSRNCGTCKGAEVWANKKIVVNKRQQANVILFMIIVYN
jgi:hypothetical protein